MVSKLNIINKKAKFAYTLMDQFSAGIVLTGTEIKYIRASKASISESFCEFNDSGELFIINMFIDVYSFGNQFNHKTRNQRKLLLNKKELNLKDVNILFYEINTIYFYNLFSGFYVFMYKCE